ncbi:MAG: ribonuclease [Pacificimonas sp.]|jgi:hypothetical protein|nr:ribonuclease [Pacificimonas sp.]
MSEWIAERGIGETRLALVEGERILSARMIRPERFVPGESVTAKLVQKRGGRGVAELDGRTILVDPWPGSATEGQTIDLVITRSSIPERGRPRDAKARPALLKGLSPSDAGEGPVDGDLSAHGWEELLEEARTGVVPFLGGLLSIVPTPAGTTIDIDGDARPLELAGRSAVACADAVQRLNITGSILIDFPSVEGRSDRVRIAQLFDEAMNEPFERTGINGFGLMQVVRSRQQASLVELVQNAPAESGALDLLRRAERSVAGPVLELRAGAKVSGWLAARSDLLAALEARTRARVTMKAHGTDPLWWGDVHSAH